MPELAFEIRNDVDGPSSSRTPLLIDSPRDSPPPYANVSPKAADSSTLLVHTPYSPGYYDDEFGESYFQPRNVRKRPLILRALSCIKWPVIIGTLIALCLCISLFTAHLAKIKAPELYAKQALNLNVSSVSVENLSSEGLQAHVIGEVSFDSSRVKDRPTRIFGRIATSIMRKAEIEDTYLFISHVDENGKLHVVGRASVPNIVVDIRDNHVTPIDFISTVEDIASAEEIAKLVQEYLQGKLQNAVFRGDSDLPLRSGILPLGTHHVSHDVKLEAAIGGSIPFSVSEFKFSEIPGKKGIQVRVAASARNPYPVHVNLPGLDWIIEAAACEPSQIVSLAVAHSDSLLVRPKDAVDLKVTSQVASIPRPFTQPCPKDESDSSSMDRYLQQYLAGEKITVYVRGKPSQNIPNFPPWVADLLEVVSIAVPVPGRRSEDGGTDKMVKSFGLSRVKVALPPRGDSPGLPRLSALVNAVIELPKELDFTIAINNLRGWSDMYYQGDKFGVLVISEWTPAQSFYTPEGYIQVVAEISDVPIEITDQAVFKKIVQRMFFAGEANVDMRGKIDVALDMPVGEFAIRNIPVKGSVALTGYPSMAEIGLDKVKEVWNQLISAASTKVVDQGWQELERESRFQREAAKTATSSIVSELLERPEIPCYGLLPEVYAKKEGKDIMRIHDEPWATARTTVTLDEAYHDDFLSTFPWMVNIPAVLELYTWNHEPDAVRVCIDLSKDQSAKENHILGYCDGSFSYLDFMDVSNLERNKKAILQRILSAHRATRFDNAERE
ncbi:hypothetical protein V1522DRAFT_404478 [Lipomyces starkeyi]